MKKILLVTLFVSGVVVLMSGQQSGTVAQEGQTKAVKRLLAVRVDTFRSAEEIFRQRHQAGNVGPDEVRRAVLSRLEAELDLADSKPARIALLEKQLEVAKALEDMVSKRQKAATATNLDILRARAFRLKFEIALEREKVSSR